MRCNTNININTNQREGYKIQFYFNFELFKEIWKCRLFQIVSKEI